jgi:hypothetical protein
MRTQTWESSSVYAVSEAYALNPVSQTTRARPPVSVGRPPAPVL